MDVLYWRHGTVLTPAQCSSMQWPGAWVSMPSLSSVGMTLLPQADGQLSSHLPGLPPANPGFCYSQADSCACQSGSLNLLFYALVMQRLLCWLGEGQCVSPSCCSMQRWPRRRSRSVLFRTSSRQSCMLQQHILAHALAARTMHEGIHLGMRAVLHCAAGIVGAEHSIFPAPSAKAPNSYCLSMFGHKTASCVSIVLVLILCRLMSVTAGESSPHRSTQSAVRSGQQQTGVFLWGPWLHCLWNGSSAQQSS